MRRALPALLFLFALAASDLHVRAQQPPPVAAVTLSLATLAPPGTPAMRVFDAWNRELGRRTNGSLRFRFYGGGVQGDDAEMVRKMTSGRIDAATLTMTGLAQLSPHCLVLQLPGTFRTYAQLDRAMPELGPRLDADLLAAGYHVLGWGEIGGARVFSTREIHGPEDLATLHVWKRRGDALLDAFFAEVHTNPVELDVPEVLAALQTNRLDTYFAPPVAAVALQWSARSSTMSDLPLSIVVTAAVVSDAAWRRLTPEQVAVLNETSGQFGALGHRNVRAYEQQSLQALAQRGVRTVTSTEADRQKWIQLGTRVRARVATLVGDAALVQRAAQLAGAP